MADKILLRQDDYGSLEKFEEDFYYFLSLTTYQFKRKTIKIETEKIDTWIVEKYKLDYHKKLKLYLLSEIKEKSEPTKTIKTKKNEKNKSKSI